MAVLIKHISLYIDRTSAQRPLLRCVPHEDTVFRLSDSIVTSPLHFRTVRCFERRYAYKRLLLLVNIWPQIDPATGSQSPKSE